MKFIKDFEKKCNGIVYLEDSVLWYAIEMIGLVTYKAMDINQRINFKASYYSQ